jgi:hypothetical protein
MDRPGGLDELGQGTLLGEKATGPSLNGIDENRFVFVVGQDDDATARNPFRDEECSSDPVAVREIEVHERYVGIRTLGLRHGLKPVAGLGNDLEPGLIP